MSYSITQYRQNGWVKIPGLLGRQMIDDMDREAKRVEKLFASLDERNLRLAISTTGDRRILEQISRISDISPLFNELRSDSRILGILKQIYHGSEAIIFKDKIIYKPPGSKGALLHQDYAYWQGFPRSLLTVLIPIDRTTLENGCTWFFSPWYQMLLDTDEKLCIRNGQLELQNATPCEMEQGDVCVFDCMTPHFSYPNKTNTGRRCLFFSYGPARDGDCYESHHKHFLQYTLNYFRPKERRSEYFFE